MSGIAGFCDFTKKSSHHYLKLMTETLSHRGPDDTGYKFLALANLNLGLGHKRLAILDLSNRGAQPIETEDGNYILIYDGRLYNANVIRAELVKKGVKFKSNTDAEVVLHAFAIWGIGAIDKYIGMFAFVMYSREEEKLYLVRDRYAIKPLYYFWKNSILLFASELKAFHQHPYFVKELDEAGFADYAQFGYIRAPLSIFKDVSKVIAGHFIEINLKHQAINIRKYWDIRDFYAKPRLKLSEKEATDEFERLLFASIHSQMNADVPFGSLLSGGYDSSFITTVLQKKSTKKIKSFCIGFSESNTLNEIPHARKISEYIGTEHFDCLCSGRDVADLVPELPEVYDEPLATHSSISSLLINKTAKQHVGILFGGDGNSTWDGPGSSTEYFGPYDLLYKLFCLPKRLRSTLVPIVKCLMYTPFSRNNRKLTKAFRMLNHVLGAHCLSEIVSYGLDNLKKYNTWFPNLWDLNLEGKRDLWGLRLQTNGAICKGFKGTGSKLNDLNTLVYLLAWHHLETDRLMVRGDKSAMATSLELRLPFTDHRLQEFTAMLPGKFKHYGNTTKYVFKKIAHKYLPKEMMDRRKGGFADLVPLQRFLKYDLHALLQEYLSKQSLRDTGVFNVDYITEMKNRFLLNPHNRIEVAQLWQALVFQMWYKRWF